MKIGILGGGQLGRMFLQNAQNYPYEYWVLDPSESAPAQTVSSHFIQGQFNSYKDVLAFGNHLDALTIEIEHVNTDALKDLQRKGKRIIPDPQVLEIIQDKAKQKKFYQLHQIPTSKFYVIENFQDIDLKQIPFPFVQKFCTGGYDGKGVQLIHSIEDLTHEVPSVIEEWIEVEKELAVIVVKNAQETLCFPTVEMVFNSELHLVDELFCPAHITEEINHEACRIAKDVASAFQSEGLYAVELFVTKKGEILVNETAPRVHNSGHATIEGNYTSQFDALLRIIAGLPTGDISMREPSTMINLIGEEGHHGAAYIEGLETLLKMEKTYLHWYGKEETRSGRKMGHITILGERTTELKNQLNTIKQKLKVISL